MNIYGVYHIVQNSGCQLFQVQVLLCLSDKPINILRLIFLILYFVFKHFNLGSQVCLFLLIIVRQHLKTGFGQFSIDHILINTLDRYEDEADDFEYIDDDEEDENALWDDEDAVDAEIDNPPDKPKRKRKKKDTEDSSDESYPEEAEADAAEQAQRQIALEQNIIISSFASKILPCLFFTFWKILEIRF